MRRAFCVPFFGCLSVAPRKRAAKEPLHQPEEEERQHERLHDEEGHEHDDVAHHALGLVAQLAEEIHFYEHRHLVAPGLTGWAQIKYPYGASVEDARQKLQYDLYYIKNQSLSLDLVIVFETVKTVLFGKGGR